MRKTLLSILLILWTAAPVRGLDRTEILVVYNESFPGSKALADYYVSKRRIPPEHVLGIKASRGERISRDDYLETIRKPVRAWLDPRGRQDKIKCILLMRGVPLTVDRIRNEKARRARDDAAHACRPFEADRKKLEAEKKRLEEQGNQDPAVEVLNRKKIRTLETKIKETDELLKPLIEKRDAARKAWNDAIKDTNASVDSELAVLFWDGAVLDREALKVGRIILIRSEDRRVQTQFWVQNMLNHRTWRAPGRKGLPRTLMVCRLDAETDDLVKRIIDDSIAVEKTGLEGVAYFDARNMRVAPTGDVSFYAVYDTLIRRAAAMVEKTGMKTVLDNRGGTFRAGSCPDTALYCGWYSLANYVASSTWVKGSVGYHIASAEATSLRDKNTKVWCKRMIDEGIAATLGPVAEPYLSSFPDPSHFFAFVLTGRYTMVEAFSYSKPMNSWMLTLVADPLYTPFRKNPKMTIAGLREALKPRLIRPPALPRDETPGTTP